MSVVSIAKNVRISPRKVGAVADLVRGRTVSDAIEILEFTPRKAATAVKKAVKSAAANATHNHNYKEDGLFVKEISVTSGMRLKRIRPLARGRANQFQRKSSHIRVVVDGQTRPAKAAKPSKNGDK